MSDHTVTKMSWVSTGRKHIDRWAIFPLPDINPTVISVLSIVAMGLIFFWPSNYILLILTVLFSIFLDWLDGLVARRYGKASARGYKIDSVCDRASELVLSPLFFYPWFYLAVINVVLTGISWRTKIHFILSIRLLFVVFVILKIIGWDWGFVT